VASSGGLGLRNDFLLITKVIEQADGNGIQVEDPAGVLKSLVRPTNVLLILMHEEPNEEEKRLGM